MKKCLMTVMAAVALGGMFTGCTKDADLSGGQNTAEFNIVQNYEKAFITRFGQPAANQTWGFGSASAGTRAVVGQPSVTEEGYTFNAQMAKAWEVAGSTNDMAYYTSWRNSGWNDKFYRVNGSVVNSTISSKLKEEIYKVIVGENEGDGLIPEGKNNLQTAQRTGYSIVTEGGPVTLTPIYHNSSSGDKISYYYYPQGSTPDVKNMKKYTIGNMADPATCQGNHNALNSNTYSLVYEDASGNVSYDFPANYVIDFIVSNTDLSNQEVTIADNRIIAEKDWTGVANLPGFVQFNNNGSAEMVPDGISINVTNRGNYWEPQLSVIDGLSLTRGANYKVVVEAKFPSNGQLQINMGSWNSNQQYNFPVVATGDFQKVEYVFSNYGADVNNDGHVLFQCGNFLGTTIFKSVKVIKLDSTTKNIANTPEFYGDGNYNVQIHNCTKPLFENVLHWAVNPATTPHAAVFDAQCTDENDQTIDVSLIGFEDWTDLDFNDVIFAVTGTKQTDDPPVIIEVPDPEPDFICRVIAEDLTVSDNTDFDFNDVVFDVYSNGRIRIRACGGTLPLTVDGQEVHGLFGKGTGEMINTGWDGEIDYENRYHDIMYSGGSVADVSAANAIVVQVQKQGGWITLSAPVGEVASKIAVGNDYEWCRERQDIDSKWHLKDGTKTFSDFVRGITIGNDWYRMVIEEAAKYQNKKNH